MKTDFKFKLFKRQLLYIIKINLFLLIRATLGLYVTCKSQSVKGLKWCQNVSSCILNYNSLFSRLTQNRRLKMNRRYLTHLFTAMVAAPLYLLVRWFVRPRRLVALQTEVSCRLKAETQRLPRARKQTSLLCLFYGGCVPFCLSASVPSFCFLHLPPFLSLPSYPASFSSSLTPHYTSFTVWISWRVKTVHRNVKSETIQVI